METLAAGAAAALLLAGAGPARAQTMVDHPIAVEMFLSQACKSCPPAAEYLVDLSKRPDIVVLSWHIDYWNLLSHPKYGRWKDPFSEPEFSARQRLYNRAIRKKGSVFTPQIIINGAVSEVGSKRAKVDDLLKEEKTLPQYAEVRFSKKNGIITAHVEKRGNDFADVMLVGFREWVSTPIKGGDNAGIVFKESNVVTEIQKIGAVAHREETFKIAAPVNGEGCAVLIQEKNQGTILAARYCP